MTVVGWLIRITQSHPCGESVRSVCIFIDLSLCHQAEEVASHATGTCLVSTRTSCLFFTGNSALDSASFVVPVTTPRHINIECQIQMLTPLYQMDGIASIATHKSDTTTFVSAKTTIISFSSCGHDSGRLAFCWYGTNCLSDDFRSWTTTLSMNESMMCCCDDDCLSFF